MNKTLLNAVAASVVIHVGALPIAAHGRLMDVLAPLNELKRVQESQSAMSFTFVDSPATQLKDEEPARKSNLISDKSTLAKDTHQGPAQGLPEAPHVDKVTGGKQVGGLAGMPTPKALAQEPPIQVPEQEPVPKQQALKRVQPLPPRRTLAKEVVASVRPVMKAQKVEETVADVAKAEEDIQLKQEYTKKIKELQEKIDRATQQIQENEKIIKKRQAAKMQEEDILRQEDRQERKQQQRQEQQQRSSSRGAVGFGGSSLHGAASDVQGDVERFGEISFNASRYELGEYFKKLKTRVEEYWLPYLAFTYSGGNLFGNKTVVFFKIMPSGKVAGAKILQHSGDELLKEFCLSSVQSIAPFDPLPETFLRNSGCAYLPIVFTFNY